MDKRILYFIFSLAFVAAACTNENTSPTDNAADNIGVVGNAGAAGLSINQGGSGAYQGGSGASVTIGAGGVGGTKPASAGAGGKTVQGGKGGASGKATGGKGGVTGKSGAGGKAGSGGASDTCNRKCLIGYISKYLDALVAQDPSSLKVSSTVKFTLNDVVGKLGDGLWKTASDIDTSTRLDYADPVLGNVATQVVVHENGSSPVIYLVRLKVVKAEITEIETMEVRQGDAANGFFNVANMVPQPVFLKEIEPSKRMKRDELKVVMELYMDYLEGKKSGAEVPFDTNCARYENGIPTASGQAAFQMQSWAFQVTRRYLIFDEEAGIAWGMFPFYPTAGMLVVGEAFKIIEGKIMMIQAVMAYMYNPETWQ
jgi:hypothetical protein